MTIEKLQAKAAHDIWAHWMKYFFTQCEEQYNGSLVVPAEKVERWKRQMETEFNNLTDDEKKSDFDIGDTYIRPVCEFAFKQGMKARA